MGVPGAIGAAVVIVGTSVAVVGTPVGIVGTSPAIVDTTLEKVVGMAVELPSKRGPLDWSVGAGASAVRPVAIPATPQLGALGTQRCDWRIR